MAEIVLIPESAISMVSCLGKTHNLPRVIKTKCQLAGCVFFSFFPFPFTSSSSILPWPLSLLCGSVGHTITLKVLVFFVICCYTTVENLCLVCLGSSAQLQVTHSSKAIIDQLTQSLIYEDPQRIFFVCVFLVPGWFISKWAWMTVCPLLAATCTSPPQSV